MGKHAKIVKHWLLGKICKTIEDDPKSIIKGGSKVKGNRFLSNSSTLTSTINKKVVNLLKVLK